MIFMFVNVFENYSAFHNKFNFARLFLFKQDKHVNYAK